MVNPISYVFIVEEGNHHNLSSQPNNFGVKDDDVLQTVSVYFYFKIAFVKPTLITITDLIKAGLAITRC